ncbi:MAG TPA: hypothetical protein VN843_06110 [Anaerolineales bacterium]|nr:hypothetical protein [Anaerolineales bacterium]
MNNRKNEISQKDLNEVILEVLSTKGELSFEVRPDGRPSIVLTRGLTNTRVPRNFHFVLEGTKIFSLT